jgi:hypothetical protein
MDWIGIGLTVMYGGAAAGFAFWLTRRKPPGLQMLATVVALVAVIVLVQLVKGPLMRALEGGLEMGLDAQLQTVPLMQTLKTHKPDKYEQILSLMKEKTKGMELSEIGYELHLLLSSLLKEELFRTPDEEIIAYFRSNRNELAYLASTRPQFCADFASRRPDSDFQPELLFPDELIREDAASFNKALLAALERPAEPTKPETLRNYMQQIIHQLQAKYGDRAVGILTNPHDEAWQDADICAVQLELFDAVLAHPPTQAGVILRGLMRSTP